MRTYIVIDNQSYEPIESCTFVRVSEDNADLFKDFIDIGDIDSALNVCEDVIDEDIQDYLPWEDF